MADYNFVHELVAENLEETVYKTAGILGVDKGVRLVTWTPAEIISEKHSALWASGIVDLYTHYSQRTEGAFDPRDGEYEVHIKDGLVMSSMGSEPITIDEFSECFTHRTSREDFKTLAKLFNDMSWTAQCAKGPVAQGAHYDGVSSDAEDKPGEVFLGHDLGILVTRQGAGTWIYESRDEKNPGKPIEFNSLTYLFFLRSCGENSKMGLLHASPEFEAQNDDVRIADAIFAKGLLPR